MTTPYHRVLVTGGAGFIGSNFIHHLLHLGGAPTRECCPDEDPQATPSEPPRILNIDALTYAGKAENLDGVSDHRAYSFCKADIADVARVEQAFREFKPDAVVHFAAESHVDRSIAAGEVFVRTNVLGTQVLLDAARRHDVSHFLHVSTDEVYGSRDKGSFKESDTLDPSSPYSASKAGSDLLALAHRRTYGLPVSVTRCTNNFGPRQDPEKLIPKAILLALRGEAVPIYGAGTNIRDWLYVKDHCRALTVVLSQRPGSIWNVAAGDERTNLEVVDAILSATRRPLSLKRFVADRPGHDFRYSLDSSRLRGTGWTPKVSFEDGLRHCLRALGAPN